MLNIAEHEIQVHIYIKTARIKQIFRFKSTKQSFVFLMNVKMQTIAGILTFISRT